MKHCCGVIEKLFGETETVLFMMALNETLQSDVGPHILKKHVAEKRQVSYQQSSSSASGSGPLPCSGDCAMEDEGGGQCVSRWEFGDFYERFPFG